MSLGFGHSLGYEHLRSHDCLLRENDKNDNVSIEVMAPLCPVQIMANRADANCDRLSDTWVWELVGSGRLQTSIGLFWKSWAWHVPPEAERESSGLGRIFQQAVLL